jgi:hypothetical protein
MLIASLGFFPMGRSAAETYANPDSPEPQKRDANSLPEHPFEEMGVAGLSESEGMPEDAITEAEAIDIVIRHTWGTVADELVENHPASAVPAAYNAQESVMGPEADNVPVWVVTLEGWGMQGYCGVGIPAPEQSLAEWKAEQAKYKCIPGKGYAHFIVDAVSGQQLGSWHATRPGRLVER